MIDCFKNLNRIECVVIFACTGKSKHCSEGEHTGFTGHLDTEKCTELIRQVCSNYKIQYVNPYEDDPTDIQSFCISSNGDVLCGNLYRQNILDIMDAYNSSIKIF